ncbi:MAG: carboxypeptidase regulatory-like domain-containing protein, partial [Bacteroidales bacterium]|nr:carboxypeptidase regulatory-like domain-containing protein [Bacteroidales bacterium]
MKSFTKLFLLLMVFSLSTTIAFGQTNRESMKSGDTKEYRNPNAPEYVSRMGDRSVILDEGFEGTFPPTGWSLQSEGTGFVQTTAGSGYTGSYAAYHNDNNSSSALQDWLITPAMDFSDVSMGYELNFYQMNNWSGYYEFHEVAVSTDGTTWTQIYTGVAPEDAYELKSFDLSAYAGQATVYIGFHYYGWYADEWYVDDVTVNSVLPIGDVNGYVFNSAGIAISNAIVGIESESISTHTNASGYYELLGVPGGTYDVSAGKAGYNTITYSVVIPPSGVVAQDFTLTQPNVTVTPLIFDETLHPNEYLTSYLSLLNTGTGAADWTASIVAETTCDMQVALIDSYGDGWNGGTLTVLVNGTPVLSGLTLASGSGPEYHSFPVVGGDNISTVYTAGSYTYENSYKFYDGDGNLIYTSANVSMPEGVIYGTCSLTWLSLSATSGVVNANGGSQSIGVNFNADGLLAGEVYTASIVVNTNPFVGTFTIPVTMTVAGSAYPVISGFTAVLSNPVTGQVALAWDAMTDPLFDYYKVFRNGSVLGTTTNTTYTDMLPGFGSYAYEVQPIFVDGAAGVKAGPEVINWFEPVLCYAPAAPENTQWPNVEREVMLDMSNCGNGVLEFSFPDYAVKKLLSDPTFVPNDVSPIEEFAKMADPAKGELDPRDGNGHPVIRGAGGPDTYGYEWIDSDEAGGPVYNWIEISGIGTEQTLSGDDAYVTIPLPFEFEFYGSIKTEIKASTNGFVTFGTNGTAYSNAQIPTAALPNDFIAAFWDDGYFLAGTSKLYTYDGGTYFVIQYQDARRLGESGVYDTYQVILYRNGRIMIQYKTIHSTTLNSNTVGIENATGTDGLQVAYNTNYIHEGLAIVFSVPTHFIVDVNPFYGLIEEGGSVDVTLTYSSLDFEVGSYNEDLYITTNEQPANEWYIPNTMNVVLPGTITGTVTNCADGSPMAGVTVTAVGTEFVAETNTSGNYTLLVDDGTYDLEFNKVGFLGTSVAGVVALSGTEVVVDAELCEVPYPVSNVFADPNEEDTQCLVTWVLPMGPYEIAYDDGNAEEYTIWASAGGAVAVKFTPEGYPAKVIGGRLNVGDGSFPAGTNFLGSVMAVGVIDDDGANGLPGTVLDSTVVLVDNYGWVDFMGTLNTTITDGNF